MLGCAAAQQPASTSATPAGILAPFHRLSYLKLYWFGSGDLAGAPSSLRQVHMVLPGSSLVQIHINNAVAKYNRAVVQVPALPARQGAAHPSLVPVLAWLAAIQGISVTLAAAAEQAAATSAAGEAAQAAGVEAVQAEQAPGAAEALEGFGIAAAAMHQINWAVVAVSTTAAATALQNREQAIQMFEILKQLMQIAVAVQGLLTPITRVRVWLGGCRMHACIVLIHPVPVPAVINRTAGPCTAATGLESAADARFSCAACTAGAALSAGLAQH